MSIKWSILDERLMNIFNFEWDNKELIDFIRRLNNTGVLSSDEKKLCQGILDKIELIGTYDLSSLLCELNLNYWKSLGNKMKVENLAYVTNKYIDYRIDEHMSKQMKLATSEAINHKRIYKSNVAQFLDRYAEVITVEKSTSYDTLLDSLKVKSEFDSSQVISTSCEFIDNFLNGGIKYGQVTTILGDTTISKSIWSLNIAYRALYQGKNVFFLTLGLTEQELNKKLLLRHSYELKFDNEIVLDEVTDEPCDKELSESVCQDFYDTLYKHLMVFDESYFDICTALSLQKLFITAEHDFKEKTGHGVDLIVIDDFVHMKLDNGKKLITSRKTIADEYYTFLRQQSKSFLGTGNMVPIIITDGIDKKFYGDFHTNDKFMSYMIPEITELLSSNILAIREMGNKLGIMVVQTNNGNKMDYYKCVDICPENWFMEFNEEDKTLQVRRSGLVISDEPDTTETDGDIDEDTPFGPHKRTNPPLPTIEEMLGD